jgi:hypothetical protein
VGYKLHLFFQFGSVELPLGSKLMDAEQLIDRKLLRMLWHLLIIQNGVGLIS